MKEAISLKFKVEIFFRSTPGFLLENETETIGFHLSRPKKGF